ncbi:MAG: hypothetical protein A4E26_00486 [Methanobacterium sp. PtaU1.Bin097]|jgi:hypothetical protein|nr:MAG: hypothetical protein A4E26_00486 [Methanobacterium sp. PtaU1.Bin097]
MVGGYEYSVGNPTPGQGAGQHAGWGLANSQIINIDIVIGMANIILLLVLLYMYLGSYREFKSKFTFGLLSFVLLLLLQNILFTSFLLLNQGFRGPDMGTPIFFLNIIEFFALIMLVWVTKE